MTTMERPRTPRRVNLSRGFEYLTLDPSPRLRRLRRQMCTRQARRDPWRIVSEAMSRATIILTGSRTTTK